MRPPDAISEQALSQLLRRALQGEEGAYRTFLTLVAERLRAFFARALTPAKRSPENIEDLVQDVLFLLHKKRDLYRADQPILPWIRAIAKHRLIDVLRAEARRPELCELTLAVENNRAPLPPESAVDVEHLMRDLDDRQRQVLHHAKVEGAPYRDIAARFGMTLSAVKVSVHRSLFSLRKNLDEGS